MCVMRQNRFFQPLSSGPSPGPVPKPSRREIWRKRLGRTLSRLRPVFIVLTVFAIALSAVYVYNVLKPPQNLTQKDLSAAVSRVLASATPSPSFESQVYQKISPSVVVVRARVPGDTGKTEGSLGTGVIVDGSGDILTCLHVVKNALSIKVVFADGTEANASVADEQPENDLAVLTPDILPDNLTPATLSSSDTLRVGDEVVAVGNPFGINGSLSSGVVSGLDRNIKSPNTGESLSGLIQFDAAVNPGNSGGPLVDRRGEVVGIVTALFNPTDQDVFIGIGFAVTIESAMSAVGEPWY
jgi:S1-C subfamily serine protease